MAGDCVSRAAAALRAAIAFAVTVAEKVCSHQRAHLVKVFSAFFCAVKPGNQIKL